MKIVRYPAPNPMRDIKEEGQHMKMNSAGIAGCPPNRSCEESAARNEQFVGECLKKIRKAPDAEEGLKRLLCFLGEQLECDRVYVFEEMDRQHIRNTYEWCRAGISSGIEELPYVAKKDLLPWYGQLTKGENIIEPDVELLREKDTLIYEFLQPQKIQSIILSPLLAQGKMYGFLGTDNPPPEKMEHISVVFDVLAYFVCSLVSQRELSRLRESYSHKKRPKTDALHTGKTVLLVDDSPQLLRLNERVLRPEGYSILSAGTLWEARTILHKTTPDAIVLDIDLPDGNGLDFCRELRARNEIPVVFLTAHSDAQTVQEGAKAGGCALLTKPYQMEELQNAVADALAGVNIKKSEGIVGKSQY